MHTPNHSSFIPLLVAIAARQFTDARLIDAAVRETLRRVGAGDAPWAADCPLAVWVAGVASAVCDDLRRHAATFGEDLPAAA